MALAPINPTQLTPPRVEFIDPRSGAISREWYRFFLSLLTATQANQSEVELAPDTASLLAAYDAMLASATQASEVASDGMVAGLESSLNSLQNAFGVTPPDLGGTVTSVAASGGATGLTFSGSPITTSGTLTLGGTLGVGYGGTGQTSYTDGQLLIGNSTGNTLTKANLIAGTNITITNGAGSITIAAAGGGSVTSVSGTGTVNGITLTGTVTTSGNLTLGGTLSGVSLTTQVTGTLPVANGGTGTATAFTAGSVVFAGASGIYSQSNANFFWDTTNSFLGIRTNAPTVPLQIGGGLTGSNATYPGAAQLNEAPTSLQSTGGFEYKTATVGSVYCWKISSIDSSGVHLVFGSRQNSASWTEIMRLDSSGNVGIGATANASALLDVQSTTKGFRLPNMTTTQKNAISSPAAGLMVFDTTLAKACVYSGSAWQTITSL